MNGETNAGSFWIEEINGEVQTEVRKKRKYRTRKKEYNGWGSTNLIWFLESIGIDPRKEITQSEVANIITDYVKRNNLVHPTKKKRVVCDERLHSLFGRKSIGRLKISDLLESHIKKNCEESDDDILFDSDDDENFLATCETPKPTSLERKKPKKPVMEKPRSCFATINPFNIKLVYLKKSLVEELLNDPESFENKVVGSFIRIRCDPNDYLQKNSHQLLQVTGIKKTSGGDGTIRLQASGFIKDINIHMLSDDNFSEAECKDLHQRVKDGLLKRPMIVDMEQKARVLHEDITKHWLARELALLENLIERANEKGWRRELDEYLQRREKLQSRDEQERLLHEIPQVIADDLESESTAPDVADKKLQDLWQPTCTKVSLVTEVPKTVANGIECKVTNPYKKLQDSDEEECLLHEFPHVSADDLVSESTTPDVPDKEVESNLQELWQTTNTITSLVSEASKAVTDGFACKATILDFTNLGKQESNSPKSILSLSRASEVPPFNMAMNSSMLGRISRDTSTEEMTPLNGKTLREQIAKNKSMLSADPISPSPPDDVSRKIVLRKRTRQEVDLDLEGDAQPDLNVNRRDSQSCPNVDQVVYVEGGLDTTLGRAYSKLPPPAFVHSRSPTSAPTTFSKGTRAGMIVGSLAQPSIDINRASGFRDGIGEVKSFWDKRFPRNVCIDRKSSSPVDKSKYQKVGGWGACRVNEMMSLQNAFPIRRATTTLGEFALGNENFLQKDQEVDAIEKRCLEAESKLCVVDAFEKRATKAEIKLVEKEIEVSSPRLATQALQMDLNFLSVDKKKVIEEKVTREADLKAKVDEIARLNSENEKLVHYADSMKKEVDNMKGALAEYFIAGFERALSQASLLYPEVVVTKFDVDKVVKDGKLVDDDSKDKSEHLWSGVPVQQQLAQHTNSAYKKGGISQRPPDKEVQPVQVIELSDDDEEESEESSTIQQVPPAEQLQSMIWYYRDPQGNMQGPFSMINLKRWSDARYFTPDFKVWKSGQSQDQGLQMARRVNMISEINDNMSALKLQVRVMSLWKVMKFDNSAELQSLEMILIDEEGGKIQATANESTMNKYQSSVEEGKCYLIGNLTVSKNNGRFKVTRHNLRLFFQNTTAMKEVKSEKIPVTKFEWAAFCDIETGAIKKEWIIDIIARVVNINNDKFVHRNGNVTRKIEVELEDESNSRMNCTLWGKYADDICSELDKSGVNCLVIALYLIIIQDVMGKVELSNSMYGTKLYINPDWEEANELKKRTYSLEEALSLKSTQLSASSKPTLEDEWLINKKTIADIKTRREVGTWNVLGTVHKLLINYDWCYSGCSKCTKKIEFENNIAKCKFCKGSVFAVSRYRVQVDVRDDTDNAEFVIWDREATQWIKKSAAIVQKEADEADELPGMPPAALDFFVGKSFLFKIKTDNKQTNGKYTKTFFVFTMTDDADMIKLFNSSYETKKDSLEICSIEANTEQSIQKLHSDTCENSITNDNDLEILSSLDVTPMKRMSDQDQDCTHATEDSPAQASSTKELKRVKIEK